MKKLMASVLACAMVAGMGVSAFAHNAPGTPNVVGYNDKDDTDDLTYYDIGSSGSSVSFEEVRPDSTYWIPVTELINVTGKKFSNLNFLSSTIDNVLANYLGDDDMFKFSFDKDGDGKSLIKSITVVNDKKIDEYGTDSRDTSRTTFLKVVTNQTFVDGEKKAKVEVTIKPKKSIDMATASDLKDYDKVFAPSSNVKTSEKLVFDMTFWVKNDERSGGDVDAVAGEAFVFDPANNEENTIVYGDDRAAIYFDADDDADKFYAKLSTKSMSSIYAEYGDPADADLWFYDWTGNKTIPSTSRATLTLGIPWDDDDDYTPNPEDCYIYLLNADGTLEDVTSKFTYDADNDSTTGIEGWTIKTRTLGTYIVSDAELDVADEEEEEPSSSTAPVESSSTVSTDGGNKGIPNTGSSDMVNVAVMAAVLSLAAAGAVAFKKASK